MVLLCSHWPTFPQIFIKGEFIGGSDIILNMHQVNYSPLYDSSWIPMFIYWLIGCKSTEWRTEGKAQGHSCSIRVNNFRCPLC